MLKEFKCFKLKNYNLLSYINVKKKKIVKDFMKVTINIPSMREQKKILSFIEVIMEKIRLSV